MQGYNNNLETREGLRAYLPTREGPRAYLPSVCEENISFGDICFDNKLEFDKHINNNINKANSIAGISYKEHSNS